MFSPLFIQAEKRILQSCVAFRKIDSLLKHSKEYQYLYLDCILKMPCGI